MHLHTDGTAVSAGAISDVASQLAALHEQTVKELRDTYIEVFDEPTRSRNKDYLRKKIAWRIQELAEGGLSERAKAQIQKLAAEAPEKWRRIKRPAPVAPVAKPKQEEKPQQERDPRLPPVGTTVTRVYRGTEHSVIMRAEAFEYNGKRYPSLSMIAREIAGCSWNGFVFFGLNNKRKAGGRRLETGGAMEKKKAGGRRLETGGDK